MKRMSFTAVLIVILLPLILSGCVSWTAERRAPPIGAFVEVDGETLHYVDRGPKDSPHPPVVLIHGASVNLRDMNMALGDALSADRRVIAFDRPGRGYSTRDDEGWRLDRQAGLIRGALDKLDIENPVIVGQSLGGAVSLAYALDHGDRMAGLVLLASVSHEWPGGVAWYNNVSGWPLLGALFRRVVLPVYAPLAAKGGVEASFKPDEAPENYYEKSGLYLLFRANDFKNNAADLRRLKPQIIAMSERYGEIAAPTAIVTGDADDTVSPELHSKALARDVDGAELTILPDTGHALHHAETERIVDVIRQVSDRAAQETMK